MRLQLLSDLHLETEAFDPEPAPDADVLVLQQIGRASCRERV